MSRRRAAVKRVVHPDAKYNSYVVAKFINYLITAGKKSAAEKILYGTIDNIKLKLKTEDPIKVLQTAIDNAKPSVEVRSRRVGGATYQVPVEVRESRALALSIRWLIKGASARGDKGGMQAKLSAEVLDAFNGRGAAIKKREDTHKMAEANKAFSHYRW